MLGFLFFVMCIINAILSALLLATIEQVKQLNHVIGIITNQMAAVIKMTNAHDEEIESLVNDVNGMNSKMEKDYILHMKDMNTLTKKVIALSKKGEIA